MKLKELEKQMTKRIGLVKYYIDGRFKNRPRIWPAWIDVYFLITTNDERNNIHSRYGIHDIHLKTLMSKCLTNNDIDLKGL